MKVGNRLLAAVVASQFAIPTAARAAGAESVETLYERAVSTAQAGRFSAAAALFDDVVAKLPPGHALRTLALYGAARANQKVGTPKAACIAIERFKLFIGMPDAEPEKREKAANGLGDLTAKCNEKDATPKGAAFASTPPPAIAPTSAPALADMDSTATSGNQSPAVDRTWVWVTTGTAGAAVIGGAILLIAASGAVSDGDSAEKRFHASGDTDADARDEVLASDDRATTYGLAGYGVVGVGALLGGVATWLWLRDPAPDREPRTAFVPGPGTMNWIGVF